MMKHWRKVLVYAFLVGLGCAQMLGDLLQLPRLKAVAAASQVAPAMKVFTAQQGYETHTARFFIGWQDAAQHWSELELTPARYAALRGPYNRRNVYGAALSYGPLLRSNPHTAAMQASVMRYGLCDPGSLRAELELPTDSTRMRVRIEPIRRPIRDDLALTWEIDCRG